MKGPLHQRLQRLLASEWKAQRLKQESLAAQIEKEPRSISNYLNDKAVAGSLDLDEADAALRLIGSTLAAFIATAPPPPPARVDLIARRLVGRPELHRAVEVLLDAPRPRLAVFLEAIETAFFAATGRRLRLSDESDSGTTPAARTKSAPRRRR